MKKVMATVVKSTSTFVDEAMHSLRAADGRISTLKRELAAQFLEGEAVVIVTAADYDELLSRGVM